MSGSRLSVVDLKNSLVFFSHARRSARLHFSTRISRSPAAHLVALSLRSALVGSASLHVGRLVRSSRSLDGPFERADAVERRRSRFHGPVGNRSLSGSGRQRRRRDPTRHFRSSRRAAYAPANAARRFQIRPTQNWAPIRIPTRNPAY